MKKIIFLLLISILSLNLFAHTKMYHIDISANFLSFDEEINREPTVDELVSGKSDEDFIDGKIDILGVVAKAGLTASRSEARRAVEQGGVSVNNEKMTDGRKTFQPADFSEGLVVKKGKKNFIKITLG